MRWLADAQRESGARIPSRLTLYPKVVKLGQTAGSKTVMQFRTVSSTRRIIFKLMPRARWNKYPITLIGYLSLYVLPKNFINPKYIIYEIPLPVFGGIGLSRVPLIIFFSTSMKTLFSWKFNVFKSSDFSVTFLPGGFHFRWQAMAHVNRPGTQ